MKTVDQYTPCYPAVLQGSHYGKARGEESLLRVTFRGGACDSLTASSGKKKKTRPRRRAKFPLRIGSELC
jgi:hypothetical protein